jgi:uncharacterized protein (TIGR00269 family)
MLCDAPAVIDAPLRCKAHFIEEFERRVYSTIDDYNLIASGERIAVAVSGGKDSLTVLLLLAKSYGAVTAIAIDEGIVGYRDRTLEDARRVCAEHGIPLVIKSFKDITGKKLDEILAAGGQNPCTVCGALRRNLIAVASKDFDVIATGHNADDESQAVLMNIIKGNTELFPRLGPLSGIMLPESDGVPRKLFTRRVKPLYFCSEKEVMTYAFLHDLVRGLDECPYAHTSYRGVIRDELNRYAQSSPEVRTRLLGRFLAVKAVIPPAEKRDLAPCKNCGEPSSSGECKACALVRSIAH